MSKPRKWSKNPTVAALLPTSAQHKVSARDASRFLAADRETQFEVMLVLREHARGADLLIPSLSFIFSGISLVVAGYNLGTQDVAAIIVLAVILLAFMVGVLLIKFDISGRSIAREWHDAYAYALQHSLTEPRRRLFGRGR